MSVGGVLGGASKAERGSMLPPNDCKYDFRDLRLEEI